jgi:hypothetical protein
MRMRPILTHPNVHVRALLAAPLLLALLLGDGPFLRAQRSDTPIIIADGSLTIDAGVPWSNFRNGNGGVKSHPQPTKSVTKVEVVAGGNTQSFDFSGQKCTVAVRYATTDIEVSTNNGGKALQVKTDFAAFRPGSSANLMAHTNASAKISRVTVVRGTDTLFTATPSGGTKITISYQ